MDYPVERISIGEDSCLACTQNGCFAWGSNNEEKILKKNINRIR